MRWMALVVAGGWLSIAWGCASDAPARAALTPRDFAARRAPVVSPAVSLSPSQPAAGARGEGEGPVEVTGPIAAAEGILDVSASVGEPDLGAGDGSGGRPRAVAAGVLVDGVVGRVNNKAIYLNEFLAPMARRLETEARQVEREQWMKFARDLIFKELNRQVEDELLLAEARASFVTPEQRASLRAYLEAVHGNILSGAGGSRQRANQSLIEEKGRTVEEEIKFREQRDLIGLELDRLNRRITVPFREVALSYERAYETYNPPPRAEFRLIRISASRKDDIAAVTQALEAGEDFATVAARPVNEFKPDSGGASAHEFRGDFATAEFWGIRELNDAAHGLSPGQRAGPITLANYVWWVHLDGIERTSMSLYDAQLSLEAGLRSRLSTEARYRLVQRLKERASFTNIDVMAERLLKAAAERYLPGGG